MRSIEHLKSVNKFTGKYRNKIRGDGSWRALCSLPCQNACFLARNRIDEKWIKVEWPRQQCAGIYVPVHIGAFFQHTGIHTARFLREKKPSTCAIQKTHGAFTTQRAEIPFLVSNQYYLLCEEMSEEANVRLSLKNAAHFGRFRQLRYRMWYLVGRLFLLLLDRWSIRCSSQWWRSGFYSLYSWKKYFEIDV